MNQSEFIADIQKAITSKKLIPVLGSGFSTQVANLPNWPNLIRSGASYANNNGLCSEKEVEVVLEKVQNKKFLDAADDIQEFLQFPGGLYPKWLSYEFEGAERHDRELYDEIILLDAPFIATTNYDKLISKSILYANTHTWKESSAALNKINKEANFVFHWHGVFDKPSSVIFGNHDYQQILKDNTYKALMEQIWTRYALLFVGASLDGLLDPHLQNLISFFSNHFGEVDHSHFILLREGELDVSQVRKLVKMKVIPIFYGDKYEQLPNFIKTLNANRKSSKHKLSLLKEEIDLLLESSYKGGKDSIQDIKIEKSDVYDSDLYNQIQDKFHDLEIEKESKISTFDYLKNSILRFLKPEEINEKIEQWNAFSTNPDIVNHKFIKSALLCNKALKLFPREILSEIHEKKPSAIHDYWLSGYLEQFVLEYKNIYSSFSESQLKSFLADDNYFFENLKRIMTSCLGVLKLDSSDIYGNIERAKLLSTNEHRSFILLTSAASISIRALSHPDLVLAELPWNPKQNFRWSSVQTRENGDFVVVAATARTVLIWNPRKDYYPKIIFKTNTPTLHSPGLFPEHGPNIHFLNDNQIIDISGLNTLTYHLPFNSIKKIHLSKSKKMALIYTGYAICAWDFVHDPEQLLTKEDTIRQLEETPEFKLMYQNKTLERWHYQYEVNFQEKDGEHLAIIRTKWVEEDYYSILLVYKLDKRRFEYVGHYSVRGIAFEYDFVINETELTLVIGLLATAQVEFLVELCSINLESPNKSFKEKQKFFKKENNSEDDIFQVSIVDDHWITGFTYGDRFFMIDLNSEKINFYKFIDSRTESQLENLKNIELMLSEN